MQKLASIDPTDFSDESGRKIHISTGPRMFFREKFAKDFGNVNNAELNNIIGSDVANSENVKTFIPGSSSVSNKKRELGIIYRSKSFGIYYICIAADSINRLIAVKESIKEGTPPPEFGSRVSTGITDPARGKEIRVNTTVRKIFKEDYKTMAFPPNTVKTFENAGILELSKYIADLYAKSANKINHVWKNPSKSENVMEIRTFGSNQFFVTILDEQYCDIISVQGQWLSEKLKKYREGTVKKDWTPSRLGKGERKQRGDYLK